VPVGQIDQHRAVVMATAEPELVNTEHPHRADRGIWKLTNDAEQRRTAHCHAQRGGQPDSAAGAFGLSVGEVLSFGLVAEPAKLVPGGEAVDDAPLGWVGDTMQGVGEPPLQPGQSLDALRQHTAGGQDAA
jgi:hypothetical protein